MPKMRWDCEKQGCFNKKKRPKIELFDECFPGAIAMSDVDGETEICGNFMRIEWKAPGVPLPVGQRILIERRTKSSDDVVFVINGDAETMDISEWAEWWRGKERRHQNGDIQQLKERITRWVLWAQSHPSKAYKQF